MAEFMGGAPTQSSEFMTLGPRLEPNLSAASIDSLSERYSALLERQPADVRAQLEAGYGPSLAWEANQTAMQRRTDVDQSVIESIITASNEEESIRLMQEYETQQADTGPYAAPDIQAMLVQNPEYGQIEQRVVRRQDAFNQLVTDRMGEANSSMWSMAGYFLDMVISSPVQSAGGLFSEEVFESGSTQNALAQELSLLMTLDIPDEEFTARASVILDRIEDAGLLTEVNPFFLSSFATNVDEAGVGSESTMNSLFQVMDVLFSAQGGISTLSRMSRRVGATPRNMSRVGQEEAAVTAVVRHGDEGIDSDMVAEGTSVSSISPARPDTEFFSGPELRTMRELEANNTVLDIIKHNNWGEMVPTDLLVQMTPRILQTVRDNLSRQSRNLIDVDVRVGSTGQPLGVGYLGRRDGTPYVSLAAAEKAAVRLGGEVIEQGVNRYVVKKEYNIPTEGLTDTLDISEVNTSFLSSILSTTARQPLALDAMLKRGESQAVNALKAITREYRQSRKGTSRADRGLIDNLLRELRDDPLHNWRREALTDAEFKRRWASKYGSQPSDAAVRHYSSTRDLNDAQYFIDADLILKQAINNKETMLRLDGAYYRARPVEITDDMVVWSTDTNTLQKGSDLDPTRATVYEIHNADFEVPGVGRVQYVTGSGMTTRRLFHTDVLGYNVGGPRSYREVSKFFMKQEGGDVPLAGGARYDGAPTTFMGVRSEDEAREVVRQWNIISEAVQRGATRAELDDLVASNNDWNNSIENFTDFEDFARRHRLDVEAEINYAGDGEPIQGKPFAGEETLGGRFQAGLSRGRARGDTPLVGYGGDELESFDPTAAVERSFASAVGRRGDQRYIFNATNAWVKAADDAGLIPPELKSSGLGAAQIMNRVEVSSLTEVGKALEQQRQTINFRMSNTTAINRRQENFLSRMADLVYGAGFTRSAKSLDVLAQTDIAGFLRAMAFHTKLGLFNPDQLMVQGSQLINIIGTGVATLNPIGVTRAVSGLPAMRLALVDNLSPANLKRIGELQAPITGISADDFIALRNWIKETGRSVVNRTAVEDNNSYAGLVGSRTLDYGQVFFNEGETIARVGAALVNLAERRRRYPNENIFDSRVTDEMIQRQDVLTASMTSASSAPWQKSLAAVPLQFVTYQIRMVEQLFMSHALTPSERWSLGLTHLITYGSAAVPVAGYLMDRYGYEGEIDPNSELFDVMRYGMMDAIIEQMTDVDTALSARLAVGEGTFDFFRGIVEEGFLETMAGPGGMISLSVGKDFIDLVSNYFDYQNINLLSADWQKLARNLTSFNRAHNYWLASQQGEYISRRTDAVMAENLTGAEAFAIGLGIPLTEMEDVWTSVGGLMRDEASLQRHIRDIERLDNIATELLESGDTAGAAEMAELIGMSLALLNVNNREEALRRLRYTTTLPEATLRQLINAGRLEMADKIQESLQ